jgi:hypothetical protein
MLSRKLLLITYHFPPSAASGAFRMLGFARHLPTSGWQPIIVAPPSLPWEPIDQELAADIPEEAIIEPVPYPAGAPKLLRKFAQYAIWLPRAYFACKRMIAQHRPDAILTSGPPHCVHLLGQRLQSVTGLPWAADFRDPWISDGSSKPLGWKQRWMRSWEADIFENADLILANAPNACRMFQETYPKQRDKIVTLTNGFDPWPLSDHPQDSSCVRLLHAGEIYAGRDPGPLFDVLTRLNDEGTRRFRLDILGRCEELRNYPDCATLLGQRRYQETLHAMESADILVLFDSPGRKIGVPAKLYEYLGAGRPILALAEPDGDTANILRSSGVLHRLASPRDTESIRAALTSLLTAMDGEFAADPSRLARFTRARLTESLAQRLDVLTGKPTLISYRSESALQEVES